MLGTPECPCEHSVVRVRPGSQCAIGSSLAQHGATTPGGTRMFCWQEPQGVVEVDGAFCPACAFRLAKTGTTETSPAVLSEALVMARRLS